MFVELDSKVNKVILGNIIAKVLIETGEGSQSMEVECSQEVLDHFRYEIDGDSLVLNVENLKNYSDLSIKIYLNELSVLENSGVSDCEFDLNSEQASVMVKNHGVGKISGSGKVDNLELNCTGVGHTSLEGLESANVSVDITGVGLVKVAPLNTLKGSITGIGKLEYSGSPEVDVEKGPMCSVKHV